MGDGNFIVWFLVVFMFIVIMKNRRLGSRQLRDVVEQVQSLKSAAPPTPVAGPDEIRNLEARVRVLERIVTDNNYALASEIEALRDTKEPAQ